MPDMTPWDWPDPNRHRALVSVDDHILWSYAMLSITRQQMRDQQRGKADRFSSGRTKWANIEMTRYQRRKVTISTLDRDDALAQDGAKACAHCGTATPPFQWDHLVPRSRLKGGYIAFNQVRSCRHCNTSRGNMDLMGWHRRNRTFPALGVLRRYLKLGYFHAQAARLLTIPADQAILQGLPFDPRLLPRKFPDAQILVWDFAYP